MGCISELLRVRRDDTLRDIESMVAAAWMRQPIDFRMAVMGHLGRPPGFRSPIDNAWTEARAPVRKAIRLATARDLGKVVQACFIRDDRSLLAHYYRRIGLGSDSDTDERVLEHEHPPPSCKQYVDGWVTLEHAERSRFALFAATIADVGIPEWRESARDALDTVMFPWLREPNTAAQTQGNGAGASVQSPSDGESSSPRYEAVGHADAGCAFSGQAPAPQPMHGPSVAGSRDGSSQSAGSVSSLDGGNAAHEGSDDASHPAMASAPAPVHLTDLDLAMIDLIVQSVAGQHGVPRPEAIGRITDELVRLNSKRLQSRFHVGFLAALSGGELPTRRGDENEQRRAWLVAGWLMGQHRRDPSASLDQFADLPPQDSEAFLKSPDAAQGTANEFIAHLASLDNQPEQLIEWIGHAGADGVAESLRYVEKLLRDDRAKEALAICGRVIAVCQHRLEGVTEQQFMVTAAFLLAKSHRIMGQFAEAERVLEMLDRPERAVAEEDPDESRLPVDSVVVKVELPASIGHAFAFERLLCALRVSHSWDAWIPRDANDHSVLHRLNGCADIMQRCLTEPGSAPMLGVAYLYGLWCVLRGEAGWPEGFPDPAEVMSDSLKSQMGSSQASAANPLRPRIEVLSALLSVGDGGARTEDSVATIADYERAHGLLPFHSVADAVETALVEEAESTWRLVLPRLGDDFAHFVSRGMLGACLRDSRLVQELIASREELGQRLNGRQRVEMMCELFKSAADQQLARSVLEDLADELIMRVSEFTDAAPAALAAMTEADRWSQLWTEEEFTAVRAGLASWCPDEVREKVRASLLQRAHALVKEDPDTALELLDHCEVLGESHDATLATRSLIKRLERQASSSVPFRATIAGRRVRVLFVGGDERQEAHQKSVLERVNADRPNTAVSFIHPGWSANWGQALDRAEAAVDQADIVVMLRFIRTRFGEGLRKAINRRGKQWRPVYGHAAPSIARAIVQAANDAAARQEHE